MMNLTDSRKSRIFTLCALYVAQGVPSGYMRITLIAYMTSMFASQGLGHEEISAKNASFIALCALPWAFKWIWGPIIDRFGLRSMGRRRPWILMAQLMMLFTVAIMLTIEDLSSNLKLLGWMAFTHNIFSALQDVSVDALAVDILEEHERGFVSGLMVSSRYLGTFIGGAGLGFVVSRYSFRLALIIQIIILLLIMMLPLFFRERAGEKILPWSRGKGTTSGKTVDSLAYLFKLIFRAFSLKSAILVGILGACIFLGKGVFAVVFPVLTNKLGWSPEDYTTIFGGWCVWVSAGGCLMGGLLADRFGPRLMIGTGLILTGLIWVLFGFAQSYWLNRTFFISVVIVEAFLAGFVTIAYYSLAMGVSWPKVAATQFTIYMTCLNLSTVIAAKIEPILIKYASIASICLCIGIFQVAIPMLLPLIDPHQTRRVLGECVD
ncbi:MAG: MFS transporter [Anaerohalosphaeraceae bacterium]|nr:MFS transporter [Anaerohalosphaeraceae bacterium]